MGDLQCVHGANNVAGYSAFHRALHRYLMRTVLPRHTRLDTPTCTRGQGRPPAMPRARQLWADPPQSYAIPLTMSRPYERHIPTGTGLQLYPPRIAIIYSRTHRNRARFCPQRPRAHPFPAPLVCGQVYLESEIMHTGGRSMVSHCTLRRLQCDPRCTWRGCARWTTYGAGRRCALARTVAMPECEPVVLDDAGHTISAQ
ncbi:hypothetical protein B0H13DRAFT_2018346 [Mycena leptocephala]|nr:hypothetical protein B0H13DRAFT_2018346 [Mycena leptocephala]